MTKKSEVNKFRYVPTTLYNYYKNYSNIPCLTRSMAQVFVHGQVCNFVDKCISCICLATKFTIAFIPWVRESSVPHCLSQKGLFVCLLVYIIIKPPELSHKPTFNHIKNYSNYISTLCPRLKRCIFSSIS